ncbi:unnamed protein product [Phyllotreta striolata]|uniref:Uncharacterized protein n=1 Tax=Phyllotreta striolata TaxID=444603 RepID=A0A9P0E065_PHYSR|nr:unnamed protein product [Phyllotreta striolata]
MQMSLLLKRVHGVAVFPVLALKKRLPNDCVPTERGAVAPKKGRNKADARIRLGGVVFGLRGRRQ